jgi:hypothetical protein
MIFQSVTKTNMTTPYLRKENSFLFSYFLLIALTLASCSSSQTTSEEKTTSESQVEIATKTPPQTAYEQYLALIHF